MKIELVTYYIPRLKMRCLLNGVYLLWFKFLEIATSFISINICDKIIPQTQKDYDVSWNPSYLKQQIHSRVRFSFPNLTISISNTYVYVFICFVSPLVWFIRSPPLINPPIYISSNNTQKGSELLSCK